MDTGLTLSECVNHTLRSLRADGSQECLLIADAIASAVTLREQVAVIRLAEGTLSERSHLYPSIWMRCTADLASGKRQIFRDSSGTLGHRQVYRQERVAQRARIAAELS